MITAEQMAPAVKRIRAYFAPVNRPAKQPTIFDAAMDGRFPLEDPPAPWTDLGWISGFERSGTTSVIPLRTGSPATAQIQARTEVDARVLMAFESWGKLQLSLACGSQQMNLLTVQTGANAAGSGGTAIPARALLGGSTSSVLQVSADDGASFQEGQLVSVDLDYAQGTTGFVGSGVSAAYVKAGLKDVDYIRRVTLNVGRLQSVSNGALTLEQPLLAGVPAAGMKISQVVGFCDREGSTFFQEWSALFVAEGQQGERVIWHYPRLQTDAGGGEEMTKSSGGYQTMRLKGSFRALPVSDPVDGERVLCFRSFVSA